MADYIIQKQSHTLYQAGREQLDGLFQLEQRRVNNTFFWMVFLPNDPERLNAIDKDESRALLVNKLQAGNYDHHLIDSLEILGKAFPVRNRSALWDNKSESEALAGDGVIHWWQKGIEPYLHFKCDMHLPFGDYEAGGATLPEALKAIAQIIEADPYFSFEDHPHVQ
ncbi:MAG: hypothetical protein RSD49_01595 [Hafnia sp.]